MVGLQPSSLMSGSRLVPLKGDWTIFCHAGSGRVGRVWSVRESLEILCHAWELNPGHAEDRQWDTVILPLSYHDPGHKEDRQWDTFILPLSYYHPGHGEGRQWDTAILTLIYIMNQATERTASEIHSFSHWAIITRAMERTESEIQPFSHWSISWTEQRKGQTVRYIHSPTELSWLEVVSLHSQSPLPISGQLMNSNHARQITRFIYPQTGLTSNSHWSP